MFTASDIFRGIASVDELVKGVSRAAILQSRTAVHANIIVMTVGGAAVNLNLGVQEGAISHLRTAKAEESLGVAIRHLIWPVASIRLRIEGQTFRTVEDVTPTVHAIHELTTMLMIADLEVTVLMGTVLGRVCPLQVWPARAIYVDRISARIVETSLRIEI